ncbi:uncharacterized protein LOC110036454 isoform X2 [Phalaenopsis equestris]|uniref:uncharacterized protein LOC110036454 isoform X2 n=1 Tax=Phalaenopsis equestris TaxID=78828 RepID=UPI0009E24BF9|nr:uncharacterized protein LOC110036454 isoform X2 [Phalaenopsis equestris]
MPFGMELCLAASCCSTSVRGASLSTSHSSARFIFCETSFLPLSSRIPFQACAAQARTKLSSPEGKHRAVISKTRRPAEVEDDEEVEGAVDEELEQLSFNSSSSSLFLNGKPDRNPALLDDYVLQELDSDRSNSQSHRSDKPQTTRHRILGICSDTDYQIVLYDTPGVIEKKMHKLDSLMMKNVRTAAINADCVLVVLDACKIPKKVDEIFEEGMGAFKDQVPILLVLNKKDLIKPGEIAKRLEWYEKFSLADDIIPVSAKYGHGVDDVKDWILSKLPLGPAYYPKDIVSEHPERFFIAEIVREKIFMQYRNEVPYACQVNVVNYICRPTAKDFIQVEIVVEKNSQKIILIGKDGKALKMLATASRLDIEVFLLKKVYLEVVVKVKENWRQDESLLKNYGYDGQIRVV